MHLALEYPHQTWTCRLKHFAVHHVTSLERLGVTMRLWGNSMNFRERMTMCSILLPEDLEIKIFVNASCPWTRHLCVTFWLQSFENFTFFLEEIWLTTWDVSQTLGHGNGLLPTSTGFMKGVFRVSTVSNLQKNVTELFWKPWDVGRKQRDNDLQRHCRVCGFCRDYVTWKTKMTRNIHHEWRGISYWTWGFSNVTLVFRGVCYLQNANV